jgi:hypothetical protein
MNERLKLLAKDLTKNYPRSPGKPWQATSSRLVRSISAVYVWFDVSDLEEQRI